MKEIKFVTHLTRNFYLYFLCFVVLKLLFNHSLDLSIFVLGMLAYAVGYAPVYFANDSQDVKEDAKDGKHNLYASIANPILFWLITGAIFLTGAALGIKTSPLGYLFLLLSYITNYFHSFKPFRLKNSMIIGSVNFFILSMFKFLAIISFLKFPSGNQIWSLIILFAAASVVSSLVYKRYKQKDRVVEIVSVSIMLISAVVALIEYPLLLVFIVPIFFIFGFLAYKAAPVSANFYQIIIFLYSVAVYLATLIY